jgi:hypothetical protein
MQINNKQQQTNKQTNKQATPSEQFQDLSEKLQKRAKWKPVNTYIQDLPLSLLGTGT